MDTLITLYMIGVCAKRFQIVKKYTEAKQNHHHEIETEVSSNDSESVECIDERSDNKVQNALMRDQITKCRMH